MFTIRDRVVLVTGGAKRIGRAIALACAGRGARIGLTYRSSRDAADATVAAIRARGAEAVAVRCDQRDPVQVAAAVGEVEARLGPVEILVNNASIFERTPFDEASLEDWDSHLEINLRGPWLFARRVVPGMRASGAGVIVNVIDTSAERPHPAYVPYAVSKAALATLTKGLARALGPEIRVNGVSPGVVRWPGDPPDPRQEAMIDRAPLKRAAGEDDIAAAVLFLVEGCEHITGAILPVDGGAHVV